MIILWIDYKSIYQRVPKRDDFPSSCLSWSTSYQPRQENMFIVVIHCISLQVKGSKIIVFFRRILCGPVTSIGLMLNKTWQTCKTTGAFTHSINDNQFAQKSQPEVRVGMPCLATVRVCRTGGWLGQDRPEKMTGRCNSSFNEGPGSYQEFPNRMLIMY
jgi:hypothetical protein